MEAVAAGDNAVDPTETEMHEFVEDGEIIQMEINDGGAAAAEFGSDADPDTGTDPKPNTDEESEYNTTWDNDKTEGETSDGGCLTTTQEERNAEDRHQLMQDRLDSMSSALEVMKDFFINSGLMDKEKGKNKNTPKKCQGGGDRGNCQSSAIPTNSEMTIYHNALDCVSSQEQIDPEISFKRGNPVSGDEK